MSKYGRNSRNLRNSNGGRRQQVWREQVGNQLHDGGTQSVEQGIPTETVGTSGRGNRDLRADDQVWRILEEFIDFGGGRHELVWTQAGCKPVRRRGETRRAAGRSHGYRGNERSPPETSAPMMK